MFRRIASSGIFESAVPRLAPRRGTHTRARYFAARLGGDTLGGKQLGGYADKAICLCGRLRRADGPVEPQGHWVDLLGA
jgi:hypothetical protein